MAALVLLSSATGLSSVLFIKSALKLPKECFHCTNRTKLRHRSKIILATSHGDCTFWWQIKIAPCVTSWMVANRESTCMRTRLVSELFGGATINLSRPGRHWPTSATLYYPKTWLAAGTLGERLVSLRLCFRNIFCSTFLDSVSNTSYGRDEFKPLSCCKDVWYRSNRYLIITNCIGFICISSLFYRW